ncbi:hypothetical protein AB4347_05660 [Vibrio breoganii]
MNQTNTLFFTATILLSGMLFGLSGAHASTWTNTTGMHASTSANLTDSKYDRDVSIHLMYFLQDNSIITSLVIGQDDYATQQICGRNNQLNSGEYKEVNVGQATINGTAINIVAVCNGALQSDYDYENKTTNYVYRWNVELQPETQKGMNYVMLQLAEGHDLDVVIDILGNSSFGVANDNFIDAFIPIWNKTKAL